MPRPAPASRTGLSVEEELRLGKEAEQAGRLEQAKQHYQSVVSRHARSGRGSGTESARCAALAVYSMAEWDLARLRNGHVSFAPLMSHRSEDILKHLGRIARRLNRIARRVCDSYDMVQMFRDPELTVLAECRKGEVYEKVADSMDEMALRVPVSDELKLSGPDAPEEFRRLVVAATQRESAKFRKGAVAAYGLCSKLSVDLSAHHHIAHALVRRAKGRLQALSAHESATGPSSLPGR